MAVRQQSIPVYKETPLTLLASGTLTLHRTCDNVAFIELSGAIEMSINDADFSTVRGGIIYKMPPEQKITKMTFREITGLSGANFTIATADGDIQDNRASFAGNLPVINAAAPNDSLQVDMLAADPGLVALAAALRGAGAVTLEDLRTQLRNNAATIAAFSRAPAIDLSGHSSHSAAGAGTQTVVTAAANTNGILLSLAVIGSTWNGASSGYRMTGAGTWIVGGPGSSTSITGRQWLAHPVIIPAGQDFISETGGSGVSITASHYKVL